MINILYTFFIITAIISTIFLLSSLNHISKLAILINIFLMISFQYLILDYYFLGLTYIIVYIGAIAILFLFIIMLISTSDIYVSKNTINFKLIIGLVLLLFTINYTNHDNIYQFFYPDWSIDFYTLTDIQTFGYNLYLGYPLIIILLSYILWIVLIGILKISK